MSVRVAFLGNDRWSVPPLEALAEAAGIEVVLVVTNPPRPAGRGSAPTTTPVAAAGTKRGLDVWESDGLRSGDTMARLRDAGPEVLAVVAYGEILGPEALSLGRLGALNLHFSLLPRWRGAAPVQWTLLAGDQTTGVTVMRMDEGLDTGPILAQLELPVLPSDDAGSLGLRLATNGAALMVDVIRGLAEGRIAARTQIEALATRAPKLGPEERWIPWAEPAAAIARRVRALAPEPGAAARFRGDVLKVLAAAPGEGLGEPGAILSADGRGVAVAAGEGAVWLLEVAPAGRRRMPAADWARGARFKGSERLG